MYGGGDLVRLLKDKWTDHYKNGDSGDENIYVFTGKDVIGDGQGFLWTKMYSYSDQGTSQRMVHMTLSFFLNNILLFWSETWIITAKKWNLLEYGSTEMSKNSFKGHNIKSI